MTGVPNALRRWRRPLFFAAWSFTFAGLLAHGRYTAFLRPEFGVLIAMGLLASTAMMLVEMTRTRPPPAEPGAALRMAFLALPLLAIVNAQGARLDAEAFRKRAVTRLGAAMQPTDPLERLLEVTERAAAFAPAPAAGEADDADAPPPADARATTITEILDAPGLYEGKRVSVLGMTAHAPEEAPAGSVIVFRFVISCCVADALPAPVLAVLPPGEAIPPENTWVRATGTFAVRRRGGERWPVLEDATLTPAAAPAQPYLF